MATIKFSKMYPKLTVPGPSTARISKAILLQVLKVDMRTFTKHFLAYDTNNNQYRFPDRGIFLLLIFQKVLGTKLTGAELFTTIRPATPGKDYYYESCVGKTFDVVVDKSFSKKPENKTPDTQASSPASTVTSISEAPIMEQEDQDSILDSIQ